MKITKFFVAATAATTLLASCGKDNGGSGDSVDSGTPTVLGITIVGQTAPHTRATFDPNATAAEARFICLDVYIYNQLTNQQVGYKNILESDFTGPASGSGNDQWTIKTEAKIATTIGQKVIFVGVNLPAATAAALKDVSMDNFLSVAQTLAVADLTNTTSGYVMFSAAPTQVTLTANAADPQNNPRITVERMVAKVTVEQQNGGAEINSPGGTISDLEFTLNNTNTKSFWVRPSNGRDPNWATAPPVADLTDLNTDYVSVNSYNPGVANYNIKYCLENTTKDSYMGQITRATVRAKFIPSEVKEYENGTDNADGYKDATYAGTAKTFWAVSYNLGAAKAFFFDADVATAWAADNVALGTGAPQKYTDGYCYWNMWLNSTYQYDVYRNDYYKCTITKIVAPGRPTAEVPDPNLPPDASVDLLVSIDIQHWNPVTKDYILEP